MVLLWLKAFHVLARHVLLARRSPEALLRLGLGGLCLAVLLAVVDDDFQPFADLLEPLDHVGNVQVIGDDADLGLVLDGPVERVENDLARLEAHPGQGLVRVGMCRLEFQAVGGLRRDQLVDRAELFEAIHERLRRHEAAGEGDVELAGKGVAPKLDGGFLRIALTQRVVVVHEHGRDAVHELAVQVGVAREMHPTEFLDGRGHGRQPLRIDRAVDPRECDAVLQRKEAVAVGRPMLDRETHEILGRLALLPVHPEQGHPVAAMQFEGKERRRILAADLKFTSHRSLRQQLVRSRSRGGAKGWIISMRS